MANPPLTESAFREALDRALALTLPEANELYRRQRVRMLVMGLFVVVAMLTAVLAFFPSLMVVFLLGLYGLYRVAFGKRRHRPRLEVGEDMRRVLLRATLAASGWSYSMMTHRYMPIFVFRESDLFDFEPDDYNSEELVEVRDGNSRIAFSRIRVAEHIDAFERGADQERKFSGWLFRVFPAKDKKPDWSGIKAPYRARLGLDQSWMAYTNTEALFHQGLLDLKPNYAACYGLYSAVAEAFRRAA